MANLKKVESDNPTVVDVNGRPVYPQPPTVDARLAEKKEALDAKLAAMDKQDAEAKKAHPPAPGIKVQ